MILSCPGVWEAQPNGGALCVDADTLSPLSPVSVSAAELLDVGLIDPAAVPIVAGFAVTALLTGFAIKAIRRVLNA